LYYTRARYPQPASRLPMSPNLSPLRLI